MSNIFNTKIDYTVGNSPIGVAIADVDGDGKPDIVNTNNADNSVSVSINQGSGTFAASTTSPYTVGSGPFGVAIADVDGDGKPDIVNTNENDHNFSVLINQGGGTFAAATTPNYPVGTHPLGVAIADVDGDGKPDIVNTNALDSTVSISINQGSGTFVTTSIYTVGNIPIGIAIADVDGDGKPDIVNANQADSTVSVSINQGGGTFAAATTLTYAAGNGALGVAIADVDGDGKPDIVSTNEFIGSLSVLINQGGGTFAASATSLYAVGSNPVGVAIADVDGDSKPDIVNTNQNDNNFSVLINQGGGTFSAPTTPTYTVGSGPYFLAIADVNADGKPDVVTANLGTNTLSVSLNIYPPCATGTYSTTSSMPCATAANGGFTNTQIGATTYTQCPAGYYNPGVGYGASYSDPNACTPAAAGSYATGPGATLETPCPAGTYSAEVGATSSSTCTIAANGGFTNTQTGATTYAQCVAGYYNPGVGYGASYSVATACTPAPIGSYVSSAGATAPTLCPAGTDTSTIAQTSCVPVGGGCNATPYVVNPMAFHITSCGNYTGATGSHTFYINLPVNTNVTILGNLTYAQTYAVSPSYGSQISITAFNQSIDIINLTSFAPYNITDFSDLIITKGSAIVNLPESQKIIIQNLNPSDVGASNFIFGASTTTPIFTLTPEHIVLPHGGSSESGILGITLGVTLGVTLGLAAVAGMSFILTSGILGCRYAQAKASYDAPPETFAPNLNMPTIGDVAMILDHAH